MSAAIFHAMMAYESHLVRSGLMGFSESRNAGGVAVSSLLNAGRNERSSGGCSIINLEIKIEIYK